jgi:hypothetical protein
MGSQPISKDALTTLSTLPATAYIPAVDPTKSSTQKNVRFLASDIADADTNMSSRISTKLPCRVATTGNITLSGTQTIDGVAVVANDRVLVRYQTSDKENGIYVVASGAWQRSSDFSSSSQAIPGVLIPVLEGSSFGISIFRLITTGTIVLGTTGLTFAPISIFLSAVGSTASRPDAQLEISNSRTGGHALLSFENVISGEESAITFQAELSNGSIVQVGADFIRFVNDDNTYTTYHNIWGVHLVGHSTDNIPIMLFDNNSVVISAGATSGKPWTTLPPDDTLVVGKALQLNGWTKMCPVSTLNTLPTTGKGLELAYRTDGTNDCGSITSYDRDGNVFKPLQLAASKYTISNIPKTTVQVKLEEIWNDKGTLKTITDIPQESDFAWLNQGVANKTVANGSIYLYAPPSGTVDFHALIKSLTGTSVVAELEPQLVPGSTANSLFGLLLRNSANNYVTSFGFWITSSSAYMGNTFSVHTPFNTIIYSYPINLVLPMRKFFLKLVVSGGNIIVSWSLPGYNFTTLYTAAIQGGCTPDQVGFFLNNPVADGFTNGVNVTYWAEA